LRACLARKLHVEMLPDWMPIANDVLLIAMHGLCHELKDTR